MQDKQELARLFQKRDELTKQVQVIDLAIKDAVGLSSQNATRRTPSRGKSSRDRLAACLQ